MYKYEDLEINILSCLLQRPELMDKVILEDKHFIKHKRFWHFIKAFYGKFGTFDLNLMYSIVKNKFEFFKYLEWLIEVEPAPSRFELYQKQLIELYNEGQKNKWIIENVFDLANDLYVREISVNDFRNKVNEIYDNADKLFKEEGNGE